MLLPLRLMLLPSILVGINANVFEDLITTVADVITTEATVGDVPIYIMGGYWGRLQGG